MALLLPPVVLVCGAHALHTFAWTRSDDGGLQVTLEGGAWLGLTDLLQETARAAGRRSSRHVASRFVAHWRQGGELRCAPLNVFLRHIVSITGGRVCTASPSSVSMGVPGGPRSLAIPTHTCPMCCTDVTAIVAVCTNDHQLCARCAAAMVRSGACARNARVCAHETCQAPVSQEALQLLRPEEQEALLPFISTGELEMRPCPTCRSQLSIPSCLPASVVVPCPVCDRTVCMRCGDVKLTPYRGTCERCARDLLRVSPNGYNGYFNMYQGRITPMVLFNAVLHAVHDEAQVPHCPNCRVALQHVSDCFELVCPNEGCGTVVCWFCHKAAFTCDGGLHLHYSENSVLCSGVECPRYPTSELCTRMGLHWVCTDECCSETQACTVGAHRPARNHLAMLRRKWRVYMLFATAPMASMLDVYARLIESPVAQWLPSQAAVDSWIDAQ